MTDQAGYTYIETDDGPYRLSQRGAGRRTKEIDDGLSDPNIRNPLVWKEVYDGDGNPVPRWEHEHDNWYDRLDITGDYLLEKCQDKGPVSPELEQFLQTPLNRSIYNTRALRNARPDETLGRAAYNPELDDGLRDRVQKYEAEAVRGGEREAYQGCNRTIPDSRLDYWKKNRCSEYMCRGPRYLPGPNGPVQVQRRVANPADLQVVLGNELISDKEKKIYQYCADEKQYCRSTTSTEAVFHSFDQVRNSGAGECLFIAVAQYLKFVNALDGVYPNYENNTIPPEHYERLHPWKDGSVMAYEAGNALRQRTVDWLESHMDEFIPSGEPLLVKDMMANILLSTIDMQSVEQVLRSINSNITEVYNEFVKTYKTHAQALKLTPITSRGQTATKLEAAHSWATNRDEHIMNHPELEPAIEALLDHFATYYAAALRTPDAYGGPLEVYALSRIFEIDVHVWAQIQGKGQYRRLDYMSYNSKPLDDPRYRTINILTTQKIGAWGGMSGVQHFEVLFPRSVSVPIITVHNEYNAFINAFPFMADKDTPIPLSQLEIMLHTIVDLSTHQPEGRKDRRGYLYDQLVNAEARKVATERKQGVGDHPDNYRGGDYLRKKICDAILQATATNSPIDVAVLINGLFRMVTRDVTYYRDLEDRVRNADELYDKSDSVLRQAVRRLIANMLGLEVHKPTSSGSVHNQILANAIFALNIPNKEISVRTQDNIITLLQHVEDKSANMHTLQTLTTDIIIVILCRFIPDMYYYKDFRDYFSPVSKVLKGGNDLLVQLLTAYLEMQEVIDFDGTVDIPPDAAAKGYHMVGEAAADESEEEEEGDVIDYDLVNSIKSYWRGPPEDVKYIYRKQKELKSKGYKLSVMDVLVYFNYIGVMTHTRADFDKTLHEFVTRELSDDGVEEIEEAEEADGTEETGSAEDTDLIDIITEIWGPKSDIQYIYDKQKELESKGYNISVVDVIFNIRTPRKQTRHNFDIELFNAISDADAEAAAKAATEKTTPQNPAERLNALWKGNKKDIDYMIDKYYSTLANRGIPAPPASDKAIVEIIEHMNEMKLGHTRHNFNMALNEAARAAEEAEAEETEEAGSAEEKEINSIWKGRKTDIDYIVENHTSLKEGEYSFSAIDIINHMTEMGLEHTRSNFDLLRDSML